MYIWIRNCVCKPDNKISDEEKEIILNDTKYKKDGVVRTFDKNFIIQEEFYLVSKKIVVQQPFGPGYEYN